MPRLNLATLTLLLTSAISPCAPAEVTILADYPGANIVVESQEDGVVALRQDIRDTKGWWFYWNFAARATPGDEIVFRFTDGNVIGTRGPAYSTDSGSTWNWLGTDTVTAQDKGVSFSYTFDDSATPVRFAFAPPYQESDLARFLKTHDPHPNLRVAMLCKSEQGRNVERLHLGRINGGAPHRLLLTARHHSCESMASYVLEGLMAALLDTEVGAWFNEHVEVLAIPFMDKDGVEAGDQGKNRKPRDHGRDYQGESIYRSTRALRAFVPEWSEGRLRFTLDLHCPHIRGDNNEHIYQVGHEIPNIWQEQQRFARILAGQPGLPLPYAAANDMPFGEAWNKASNYTAGAGVFHWTASLDGVRLASAIEIPYANVGEVTVTPDRARAFGAALLPAIREWLETLAP